MPTMDIFSGNAFNMVTLTTAINKQPYLPTFLGSQNLFEPKPVRTTTVAMEKKEGKLALIQTSPRGAPIEVADVEKRDIRDFRTVRIAKGDQIMADELQNVRAFGSETEFVQIQQIVADRLKNLNNDIELTHENMRLGAIQGIVTDADGAVIRNWYQEWGIAQPAEINFALNDPATGIRKQCANVIRAVMRKSQGAWVPGRTRVHALCGDEFFDALIDHQDIRATYLNQQAAAELRQDKTFGSFEYGGIVWHNYRGTDDGTTVAIESTKAKFYPVGGNGVFQVAYSPSESLPFVNTLGQRLYAMIIRDKERDAWVKPELYSYPLYICTRPEMLQRAKLG